MYFKKVTEFIKKIAHFLTDLNASLFFNCFSYKMIKNILTHPNFKLEQEF